MVAKIVTRPHRSGRAKIQAALESKRSRSRLIERPAQKAAVRVASPREGRLLFDGRVQRELNMSGAEFLDRWERGDYLNDQSDEGYAARRVALLIPFARRNSS